MGNAHFAYTRPSIKRNGIASGVCCVVADRNGRPTRCYLLFINGLFLCGRCIWYISATVFSHIHVSYVCGVCVCDAMPLYLKIVWTKCINLPTMMCFLCIFFFLEPFVPGGIFSFSYFCLWRKWRHVENLCRILNFFCPNFKWKCLFCVLLLLL